MFKNVLVGVDGRPSGRDAIALASRLIDPDGRLTLAHVHGGELRLSHAISPGVVREERAASQELLEQERAGADVSAELVSIAAMNAGGGLHMQAEEQDAELLVVGSSSRSALGRAMLGDDTRAALNGAPCAVAIGAHGYAQQTAPIAKIGVAYNGSQESMAALAVARKLAAQTNASLYALQVVAITSYAYSGIIVPDLAGTIEELVREANDELKKLNDVAGRAVYGLTGEELAAFGDEVDILLVGSRSYGPMRRLVLGSTSDYLERHARCSLIVLPRAAATGGATNAGEQAGETAASSSS
jgi:nucleotide-binding universal stress UspA family protein